MTRLASSVAVDLSINQMRTEQTKQYDPGEDAVPDFYGVDYTGTVELREKQALATQVSERRVK